MEENKNLTSGLPEETPAETTPAPAETEEKDTTVELRENYDEAVEEGEKAKVFKKAKMTRKKKMIIIIASVTAAVILGVALFFLIPRPKLPVPTYGALNPPVVTNEKWESMGITTELSAEMQTTLAGLVGDKVAKGGVLDLAEGKTEQEVKEAAMALYDLANDNKINAEKCVMIAQGAGNATVGGSAGGEMEVRAFRVQDNGSFYYQKGAKLVDTTIGMRDVVASVLDQQERTYYPGTGDLYRAYYVKGSKAKVGDKFSKTIPFLQLGVPTSGSAYQELMEEYNYEAFQEKSLFCRDPKEINNFKYAADAIKNVEFKHYVDEKYYEIIFDLDIPLDANGEVDTTSPKYAAYSEIVKAARQYLRNSSKSDDLEFKEYHMIIQIWDNGYIKKFYDTEHWAGNATILGNVKGLSESTTYYECAFYWDYDSLVADGFISAEDTTITKENFTKDIIDKYAKEANWKS